MGGLIFPGPRTALTALSREAAKLPIVNLDVRANEPTPGRNTTTSIQHGIVFGFACMVEGLTQRLKRQMSGPVKVLGTGGFASSIARVSNVFDQVLPMVVPPFGDNRRKSAPMAHCRPSCQTFGYSVWPGHHLPY